jgi:CheY-like chemotaxis protein
MPPLGMTANRLATDPTPRNQERPESTVCACRLHQCSSPSIVCTVPDCAVRPPADKVCAHHSMRSTRRTVLVVDDDASTRELIAQALEMELDVVVLGAGDGREGVAAISASNPDLILLDLKMPRLDGLGVLHWLKSSPRTSAVPVLALTAAANDSTLRSLERRCDGVISKPFDLNELFAAVRPCGRSSGQSHRPWSRRLPPCPDRALKHSRRRWPIEEA